MMFANILLVLSLTSFTIFHHVASDRTAHNLGIGLGLLGLLNNQNNQYRQQQQPNILPIPIPVPVRIIC